jgi:23S rRNA (cytosine1962-C5)-methyltransferase
MSRVLDLSAMECQLSARVRALAEVGTETEAFRLVDAEGEGMPGLWVDVFGGHWLVQTKDRGLPLEWAGAVEVGLCESIWLKRLAQEGKEAPVCVAGVAPQHLVVRENGMRLEIQPGAGYSCGLFIDQRDNRQRVRRAVRPGQRVLNLFSYTCSFSVAAALAGAVTTSVDLNAGYLEWGKRNFRLNELDPEAHYWIKGDSFDWLAAFAKKGRRFDGVILDPPTFSRGGKKKAVFRVERDYAELLALAAAVVEPGGWLLASANTHRMEALAFRGEVLAGVKRAGRQLAGGVEELRMPVDFTGSSYLKCLWLDGVV